VLSLVTNAVVIPDGYRSIKEEVEAEVCAAPLYIYVLVYASVQLWHFSTSQLAGRKGNEAPDAVVSHEEVLQVGRQKAEVMRQLVEKVVELVPSA
jgi:purine-nucleoside phosphorylase